MSKKIKYKPVKMDVAVQLTSNGYYVVGADVTTLMWKRLEGVLRGRLGLVNASHLNNLPLPKTQVVVFNKALVDRSYIIERVFSRSEQYHSEIACVLNRHIIEWLVSERKIPSSMTVLYDHDLEHPRNTTGGSQMCSLLENADIRAMYQRTRVISDQNGLVKKEVWRLK